GGEGGVGDGAEAKRPQAGPRADDVPEQRVAPGHVEERGVVRVKGEQEAEPLDGDLRLVRGDPGSERAVATLPDLRVGRHPAGLVGQLQHSAPHAAREVAVAGRAGERERPLRPERGLDGGAHQPTEMTATAQIRWSSPSPNRFPFGTRAPPSTARTEMSP